MFDIREKPNMVERAFVLPPASQIGPITEEERKALMAQSVVSGVYEKTIDRESAYEKIKGRVATTAQTGDAVPTTPPSSSSSAPQNAPAKSNGPSLGGMLGGLGDLFGSGNSRRESAAQAMFKTAARSIGSQVGREIIRGVFGSILKK